MTIAFESEASNLAIGDSDSDLDVFARRLGENFVILISDPPGSANSKGSSHNAKISGDGSTVVYQSDGNNLQSAVIDNNGAEDVFTRKLTQSHSILVSVGIDGRAANSTSNSPTISNNGRFIAFRSFATNLANGAGDVPYGKIFIRDLDEGDTRLITTSISSGVAANSESYRPIINATGSAVVLLSLSSNLVPNDNNGTIDIFLFRAADDDFGDAPANYPVTIATNGARHALVGPRLGARRDGESNGIASADAKGDDLSTANSDEDGVTIGTLTAGLTSSITVNVQDAPVGAKLDAWIDFAGDGNWNQSGDRIATNKVASNGNNTFSFLVPANAITTAATFARFRISTAGGLSSTGPAVDGEVEDYRVEIAGVPKVQISFDDFFVEGSDGQSTVIYTVTRTHNLTPISVDFATANGTAVAGSDYVAKSGTLQFPAGGPLEIPIAVTIIGDKILENDETFTIQLSNPVGAVFGNKTTASGTIFNDDTARVSLSTATPSKLEGSFGGTTTFPVVATLLDAVQGGLQVNLSSLDSTATLADLDFVSPNQTLNFSGVPGQAITVPILVNRDNAKEFDEQFFIRLSNPITVWNDAAQVVIENNPVKLTIINDDMIKPVAHTGGPYSIVTGVGLGLDASQSFDDDGFASYLWDLDNDGQYDDASGYSVYLLPSQLTALGLTLGTYPISVFVEDNTGDTDVKSTTLTIALNQPPIAEANGPYFLDTPMRDLMLSGMGSMDPDGDNFTLFYEWDLNADQIYGDWFGDMATIGLLELQQYGFKTAGVYPIGLRVTDEGGQVGYDFTTLTINNTPPMLDSLFPMYVYPGSSLNAFSLATDFDDDPFSLKYEWDLNGDGDYSDFVDLFGMGLDMPYSRFVEYGYSDGGTFPISVRVTDPFGGTAVAFGTYDVEANLAPIANLGGPFSLNGPMRQVALDGTSSMDPDGNVYDLTYAWDLDNDGLFDDGLPISGPPISGGPPFVNLTLNDLRPSGPIQTGVFPISLRVTDIYGKSSIATTTVTVDNQSPGSVFIMTPLTEINAGDLVSLSAEAMDPDDDLLTLTYQWDFNLDGNFNDAVGQSLSLTHGQLVNFGLNGGTYTIAARVTDPFGASSVGYAIIEVGVNDAPIAIAGGPYTLQGIYRDLMLDASTSYDPDGDSINLFYDWDLDNDGQYDDASGPMSSLVLEELISKGIDRPGSFPISLRVTDEGGAFGFDSTSLSVTNAPPVASAGGPYDIMPDNLFGLFLMGSGTDPDDDLMTLSFDWDLDLDGNFDDASGESASISVDDIRRFGLLKPQSTIRFRMTDAFGAVSISDATVNVNYTDPIVVTSSLDVNDPLNDATELTLREAIQIANFRLGPDLIQIPAGLFALSLLGTGEDSNDTGDLDIFDDVVIIGSGAGQTVIDASLVDERVIDSAGPANIYLQGVTISGGKLLEDAVGASDRDSGGGIYSGGHLTVVDSVVTNNAAHVGYGGGLYSRGTVRVVRSTIAGNDAAAGGGVAAQSSTGGIQIIDSAVVNNTAVVWGGGIYSAVTPLLIVGSTISGNATTEIIAPDFIDEGGGGIQVDGGSGTIVTIRESTITNNQGTRFGGGVQIDSSVTLNLRNTIIAGNFAPNRPDIHKGNSSTVVSLGHNLIGIASAGTITATPTDLIGTLAMPINAGLQSLANYGGKTVSHNLSPTSPALDAGSTTGVRFDQRGIGFPRRMGDRQDIGAVEAGDDDGIDGVIEDGAPNGGDGNSDGILDSLQVNVASLPNAGDGNYVTIASDASMTVSQIKAFPIPIEAPIGISFDMGVIDFTIREVPIGGSTTVTLILAGGTVVDTYYKFGPTPDNLIPHWYEFLYDAATGTGAVITGSQIVVYLTDGARGDDDLLQNGVIVDPGVPGFDQLPVIHSLEGLAFATAGDGIAFRAIVTDAGSAIEPTIEWDFGDGSAIVTDDLYPVHSYDSAGSYVVTLTVTDFAGRVVVDTTSVQISPPPPSASPTDIALSSNSINENTSTSSADLFFASLAAVDEDLNVEVGEESGDSHTFALVPGNGDTDNLRFNIVGNELRLNQNEVLDHETQDSFAIRIQTTDSQNQTFEKEITLTVNDLVEMSATGTPGSSGLIIGDGTGQRSRVEKVTLQFDSLVTLQSGALTVTTRGTNQPVTIGISSTPDAQGRSVVTITFLSHIAGGSLIDGYYLLNIDGSKILNASGNSLDLSGDGIGDDSLVYGDDAGERFFRRFGNLHGNDNDVDGSDLFTFLATFNKPPGHPNYNSAADFDGDGDVDGSDLFAFRQRFNKPF